MKIVKYGVKTKYWSGKWLQYKFYGYFIQLGQLKCKFWVLVFIVTYISIHVLDAWTQSSSDTKYILPTTFQIMATSISKIRLFVFQIQYNIFLLVT